MAQYRTHPLTSDRFEDFADVVNPNRRGSHCWCLSHRLTQGQIRAFGGQDRETAMRAVVEGETPPGVITYADGVPIGWVSIAPRQATPKLVRSRVIRPVDDVEVWCIICVIVRGGHRRQGATAHMIEGAVAYAGAAGAPAVEVYPANPDGRMDTTMAFVGTRSMFEPAGFEVIGVTEATASGMPRLVMRRTLSPAD
ncbi:GNAT family N-acetyltransferase [Euzebya tangerina]|uniref:GNAT family N-acetyltransferase n=1 Tax=Euzebya tangerina TaxID=591198 RepID=UPI000E31615C|nr:GNAT family N-acetyltransferase [Euzebya tangerina]